MITATDASVSLEQEINTEDSHYSGHVQSWLNLGAVADGGVMHFTHKREAAKCLVI